MKEPYLETRSPSAALHAPSWHAPCPQVSVVDIGGRAHLFCGSCRCLVSMEAVAIKADLNASFQPAKEAPK